MVVPLVSARPVDAVRPVWVQPGGARLRRFACRFSGKQELLALGVYPTIPLARARQCREDAGRVLADGLDPAAERKRQAEAEARAPTFRGIAEEYLARLKRENRSEATIAKTEWLPTFVNAEFGEPGLPRLGGSSALLVDHAPIRTRRRSGSKLARPQLWRFSSLSRLTCSSP